MISFTDATNSIELGDLVEFKCLYLKNNRDSLPPDSIALNEIFNDTITFKEDTKSDLLCVLKHLGEGDSCLIQLNHRANFEGKIDMQKNKITAIDTVYVYMKVKHIYRGKSKAAYWLEESAIARYITFSSHRWQASPEGIFYRILKPSSSEKLHYNDPVKLVYRGYFLNTKVFDNYSEINPYFEYRIGTQNQLIAGMEIALNYMSYGTEAEFIFPSSLAFGSAGSSTGIVPAYKPVLYKVKILEQEKLQK